MNTHMQRTTARIVTMTAASTVLISAFGWAMQPTYAGDQQKVAICHAASSGKYVELRVDAAGLNGHGDHGDDLVPAPVGGCPSPVVEEPVVEEPVVEEPVVEEPVVEEPVVEEPVIEEPVIEEPVVEEGPRLEGPVVEQPVVEVPIPEAPVGEEPVVEVPVVEGPAAEVPVPLVPVGTQPVIKAPAPGNGGFGGGLGHQGDVSASAVGGTSTLPDTGAGQLGNSAAAGALLVMIGGLLIRRRPVALSR